MKVYKTQREIEADIKDGVLAVEGDVKFECSFVIEARISVSGDINAGNINAGDINAGDINAGNINAGNINAGDINAGNINAGDINARNIDAGNINAGDINARNIDARDINAGDINARNIKYYAACLSYKNIKCNSITAKRDKHCDPVCLDGKFTIVKKEDTEVEAAIKLLESKGRIVDGKVLR